ncbi:ABC transporter substrate-binding protein [Streptomyces sp. OE57]|uniref:ABC transporter substrate-binding protein n=1 Tax=Streptomyces lacaronensis TaxID=3379885 RepID=UPI0039B788F5
MSRTARTLLMPVLALATALLTACGSSAEQPIGHASYDCTKPNRGSSPTKVSVSALPTVSNGALYAGVKKGFFAANGLDVKIQPVASHAASLAAVQGGTSNFAFTNSVALFQAIGNGVPLRIVAPFAGIAPGYYDKMKAGVPGYQTEISAIVVNGNSGITRPKDLTGKTVALIDVQGQSELTTRYVIDHDGGDSSKVKFVNLSLADGANALSARKVDAAYTADPFLSKLQTAGAKVISWPGVETFHEGPTSAIVSSASYITANRETVARFNCGVRQSAAYANAHHKEIRAVVAAEQKVDPATLANAVVAHFYDYADIAGLNRFKKIMLDYKFLDQDFAIDDVVVPEAVRPDDHSAGK